MENLVRIPYTMRGKSEEEICKELDTSKGIFEQYKRVKREFLISKGITPTLRSEGPNHLDFALEEMHLRFVLNPSRFSDPTVVPKDDELISTALYVPKSRCCAECIVV